MSSSDNRIIKDIKSTRGPAILVMHEFQDFDTSGSEDTLSAGANHFSPESAEEFLLEKTITPQIKLSDGQMQAVIRRSADDLVSVAQDKAEKILEHAATEAAHAKTQAMEEISGLKAKAVEENEEFKKQVIEQAKEAGLQQGLEEARRQMADQVQEVTDRCNAMIASAEQEAKQIVMEAEPQIIDLVMAISRKIITDEVAERQSLVLGLVRDALERVKDQKQINIHVSSDDYEFVMKSRSELQGIVGAEQSLSITADAILHRGGCLIETSFGTVEAGVETQLESIRKVLQGMLI